MAKKSVKKVDVKKHAEKIVSHAKKHGTKATKAVRKTTKSKKKAVNNSNKLKVYSNVSKRQTKKHTKARKKADYLATLPKNPVARFFHRLHPKQVIKYWFSRRGALMFVKLGFIGVILFVLTLVGVFAYFRRDLPDPNDLSRRQLNQTTRFYDRSGRHLLFEVYGDQRRTVVDYEDITQTMKDATVAVEDKDFREHRGFSLSGILRAAFSNISSGDSTGQGGSTITQQFIKNSLLTSEQTYTRKLKELILAIELERLYTKDEILAFYLNEISYGGISYGVEAAAQSYFEKEATELTLDESALLAAMPQAPGDYSPYGENTELLVSRQKAVLRLMREQGFITKEEEDEATEVDTLKKIVPLDKQSAYKDVKAPHFVELVKKKLVDEFGRDLVENGGLTVKTTLSMPLQNKAEKAIKEGIDNVIALGGNNAAISATQVETGQVMAQVGSRDFFYPGYGRFNAASPELGRQPGSSFKPYAYAEMMKSDRWGAGSQIWDTQTNFGNYKPDNHSFRFFGNMTLRSALAESRNIPAVKALYIAGVDNTIDLARGMGMKSLCSECEYGLSLVLGSGEVKLDEHVHAYSTFARGGVYKEQTYILKVENAAGEVIKQWKDTEGEQVLDEEVAYIISDMLADESARARLYGSKINTGYNVASKTGTTDESVDGWLMGYSTCLAAGVWVGNHDGKAMHSITSSQTGPIFVPFMQDAHEIMDCGKDEFAKPEGVKNVSLNIASGRKATSAEGARTDIFPSWYKPAGQGVTSEAVIDTVSKKLATNCTPPRAKQKSTVSAVLPELDETDPMFDAWAISAPYNRSGSSVTEKDDVHKCSDKRPTVSLTVNELGGGSYQFAATISKGTHPLDKLEFKVNNQIVNSKRATSAGTYTYKHVMATGGSAKFTATVIDSKLYDDSSSRTINVTGVNNDITITSPSNGSSKTAPVTVDWQPITGADEYRVCYAESGNSATCDTISAPTSFYILSSTNLKSGEDYSVTIEALESGSAIGTGSVNFSVD